MLRPDDFRLLSVQATAFTPGPAEGFRPSMVLASVLSRFAPRFNGDVQASTPASASNPSKLDIPPGQMAAIQIRLGGPAVVLTSEDGAWKFESGPTRTDSHWQSTGNVREDLETISANCMAHLAIGYPMAAKVPVGRIALVVKRWAPVENAASALSSQFCLPRMIDPVDRHAPFRHSRTFRIDNLKRYTASPIDRQVNSWVRCYSDALAERPGIFMEQDINTLAEEADSTVFAREEINEFFGWAPSEMNEILSLYFGSE